MKLKDFYSVIYTVKKPTVTLARRKPLVKNLLLLDGMGRAGKFLAANVLNGFADVEPVQLCGLLEHIPYFEKLGLMDTRAAQELLHHEVDMHAFEMLIGRNLNHRAFDKSSIFHAADSKKFIARAKVEDRGALLKDYYKRGAYSLFLVHEVLPDSKIYFDSFPALKIISLTRSPVDLAYSWYTRHSTKRWGQDPTFFNIPLQGKKGAYPWYMHKDRATYETLLPADQNIFIIETLFKRYASTLRGLSPAQRRKILFVSYEDVVGDTAAVLKKMQKFLGKEPLPGMNAILKREKLPNPGLVESKKEEKVARLKADASPEYFKRLMALEKKYYAEQQ